jgi:hypothetical protein
MSARPSSLNFDTDRHFGVDLLRRRRHHPLPDGREQGARRRQAGPSVRAPARLETAPLIARVGSTVSRCRRSRSLARVTLNTSIRTSLYPSWRR